MARWSEEEREFHEDSREKKRTAASSHKQRTHCGKGGRVRFPSDNLTKKELKAMSGECVTYNLKKPMDWATFKSMPEDLQKEYVRSLRARFGCNNSAIADMLGTGRKNFQVYVGKLGLKLGKGSGNDPWDVVGFNRWKNGEDEVGGENASEAAVEAVGEENASLLVHSIIPNTLVIDSRVCRQRVVPATGSMDFEGNIRSICDALVGLLDGEDVFLEVSWHIAESSEGKHE